MTDKDSTAAQHLHDYRVNKTRGHEVRQMRRTCIECGRDAVPRYLYCSDECSELSRQKVIAAHIAGNGRRQ